jgi:hypothetical protein
MPHVVLLGDSIFDNRAYVRPGEPDVIRQVRAVLPAGWSASLAAVDGAMVEDVHRQLRGLPEDATHLVLSAGGNDALAHVGILDRPVRTVGEALDRLDDAVGTFRWEYEALLRQIADTGLPLCVGTIYHGAFPEAAMARRARMALTHFNDAIVHAATSMRLRIVDLRRICTQPEDYANPIEPSARGGEKMAQVIARAVLDPPCGGPSDVYP